MAQVQCNVSSNDPVTGKKIKAQLTGAPIGFGGYPSHVTYKLIFKETDDNTDAIPSGPTEREKKAVSSYEETFQIDTRLISSTTKLYLPYDSQDVNKISLQDYFANKVINTYSGVGGGDASWKFAEGLLKEVVAIKQANGELPV